MNPALIGLAKRWHATTTNALKTMLLGQAPTDLPPLDLSTLSVRHRIPNQSVAATAANPAWPSALVH